MESRTGHPEAPRLIKQANDILKKVRKMLHEEVSTVNTEVRQHTAFMLYSATYGTPAGEEAKILHAEGFSYLCV